ncbi:sugar phosphate isomerase/epimerase family protein [Acutalibacter caecimuris]|uniref:sugar phosphate isomerase/epimerase family protein n=1 Tax=Acutalibacter caecimuris TaxID=3093657 RepID=UPI002AC91C4C|nr:sugar phosphate isomerase/epimerase [Acutalibacter sp. M00118]
MKKGVQLFTVRDHLGSPSEAYATLKRIRDMGYNAVQLFLGPSLSAVEMHSILKELGLENCAVGVDYERLRRGDANAVKEAVELAHLFHVHDLDIPTLPEEWRETKEGYENFAKEVNRITPDFVKEGLHLLYHPHALEFYSLGQGKKGMDILFAETDPNGLHFALDTHWLAAAGVGVTKWLRRAKGRMDIVHFKDYAIVGGAKKIEQVCKDFAEVGEGNLDWPEIISVCREIGVKYAIVEQDVCPIDPFTSLEISSRNLTNFGVTVL